MKSKIAVFWFRRDLRLEDNAGLHHALASGFQVLPIFIFDIDILSKLENKKDRRLDYINQALHRINLELKTYGSTLETFCGRPLSVFKELLRAYDIQSIFCNRDYEPQAIERDTEICRFFKEKGIAFRAFKDQVIFDKSDILKDNGTAYTVYTPYAKKWKNSISPETHTAFKTVPQNFYKQDFVDIIPLEKLGFEKSDIHFAPPVLDAGLVGSYDKFRDFPAISKTTRLGIALRFGILSVRKAVAFALEHNHTWLSELVWREFFMQILYHFPYVAEYAFKTKYDHVKWLNNEADFSLWCEGKTGYPLVDAGMRELNQTGFMHNRVRMVTASFLCKQLLIDWRWGEAYFAQKLNDFDLAANNGNWQWASGSGCDAAPYFRVFNPIVQAEKFDRNLEYIRKWLPEFGTKEYPEPIVEHVYARQRALKAYAEALNKN